MIRPGRLLLLPLAFVVATAAPALGHAERAASTPEERARLDQSPSEVSVTFTEPPIADADFKVFDGCKNDVTDDLDVQGMDITASVAQGQPGRWRVAFHVVSAIDGHATRESFNFRVRGSKDCGAAAETPPPSADEADEPADEGGSVALIALFAGGTVLVVVLALVLRGRKS